MDLKDLTIKSFGEGLREKKFSALEVAAAYFENIKKSDPSLGAYLCLLEESAMLQAEKADLALQSGADPGPLAGVPLAVKDNILIKGFQATAASKMLENYKASYDAGVIEKLKKSGAVFLGKTNMDEFAMGSSTENSAFRLTRNPRDMERVPGGSSGGSAAAVAGDLALAALGSDTGGSIRQPAALCGVVGLKPTYGAVSRSGLIAMASSLDQIGPITKTAADAAQIFMAIQGGDPLDNTSVGLEYDAEKILSPKLDEVKKLRVGLPEEFMIGGLEDKVEAGVKKAIEKIKSLGVEFKRVSLPSAKYALSTYYIIMPAEVSSNLARFDGIRYGAKSQEEKRRDLLDIYLSERGRGFGAETKRRIILGTFVLSSGYYDAYYEKAQRVRALMRRDIDAALKEVDVILSPTTPTTAFKIGEKTSDPLSMYLSDIFTIPANMAGVPAISMPVEEPREGELPVGFQLMGRRFGEADILGLAQYYEKLG
jgi:aspartyl-tRNA(Asn)/glutamyl-tRNA(Gln) amidotransferase subunit A